MTVRPGLTIGHLGVVAVDFGLEIPAALEGGAVELSFLNRGHHAHALRLGRLRPGAGPDDVEEAFRASPGGAPPDLSPHVEDVAGLATADPGVTGSLWLELSPGSYVLYCPLVGPDGVPHGARGMVAGAPAAGGRPGPLPAPGSTVTAADDVLDAPPPSIAGRHLVALRNTGSRVHEINLVQLAEGRSLDDVVDWYRRRDGPPPMRSLSGVAAAPGREVRTELELEGGRRYALVCAVVDGPGEGAAGGPHPTRGSHLTRGPHLTRGMVSAVVVVP